VILERGVKMTTKDVKEFLQDFSVEELKEREILRGATLLLNAGSIDPLVELMKEHRVDKLVGIGERWFLDTEGNFANPGSTESKKGKIRDLSNPGNVFMWRNRDINPHYRGPSLASNIEEEIEEAGEITVGLERDLQAMLRQRIEELEPGLRITDGGKERTVEAGRIDITAEDKTGKVVAVELKAGTAKPDSITQVLAYMACLKEKEESKSVRGILVAGDFNERVLLAARAVPNLKLKQYSVRFSFKDR